MTKSPDAGGPGTRLVWIVEDDEPIARCLQMLMQDEGFQVAVAHSLEDARHLEGQPSLVLLDYLLPDGNGIVYLPELARQHPGTPVILLTALERIGLSSFPSHVSYLPKPFKNKELVQLVRDQFASPTAP